MSEIPFQLAKDVMIFIKVVFRILRIKTITVFQYYYLSIELQKLERKVITVCQSQLSSSICLNKHYAHQEFEGVYV